jgi:hypothetical protein
MKNAKLAVALCACSTLFLPAAASAQTQPKSYALESPAGLKLHNVVAEAAVLQGKKGVKLAFPPEAPRPQSEVDQLAWFEGVEFSNGVIEAEIAGAPAPGAGEGARGFVGIAFRLQPDNKTYDAFYLRPTNGRVEDQERRNRSTQYISHPDWPWHRLRKEAPGRYESYVDVVPGEWTKVRIEVRGDKARLYVHGSEQPALIVNDVKSGPNAKGAVGLWLGIGTVAHFRNLTIKPDANKP